MALFQDDSIRRKAYTPSSSIETDGGVYAILFKVLAGCPSAIETWSVSGALP